MGPNKFETDELPAGFPPRKVDPVVDDCPAVPNIEVDGAVVDAGCC